MLPIDERRQRALKLLREHSPWDETETERIIGKFFARVPSYVRLVYERHGLGDKRVLDIGSTYGQSLLYWGDGSESFEVSPRFIEFLRSIGARVHVGNVEDDWPSSLEPESFDAVFANNIYEHLIAPHLFLARIFRVLRPGGTLVLGYPVVPAIPFRWLYSAVRLTGWLAVEHIGFFTPHAARLNLERNGFSVSEQHFTGLSRLPLLSKNCLSMAEHCLTICTKIDGYRYHNKREEMFDPAWARDLGCYR